MNNKTFCLLFGLALATCSSVASAVSLSISGEITPAQTTSDFAVGQLAGLGEQIFNYGVLDASGPGIVTFTYIGADAGYTNYFGTSGTPQEFTNLTTVGQSFTQTVTGGALDFQFSSAPATSFSSTNTYTVVNSPGPTMSFTDSSSHNWANEGVFGIVGATTVNGNPYQALLIYNDPVSNGDRDYNDLVVGVNITSAIPEPKTYAMWLAGVALIGFVVYRRKNDSSNMMAA